MLDLDHWREIARSLGANKTRTALTAFGVFWGIFMLVVMLGSGNGLQNGMTHEFSGLARNSFYVWTRRTTKPYRGLPAGRSFTLRNGDIEAVRNGVPEVDVIAPRNQLGGYGTGNNVAHGDKAGGFNVMGDYPEFALIQPMHVMEGRFLNPLDLEEGRKVAVIGSRVREVLFEDEPAVGKEIHVNGIHFQVVGTFQPRQVGDDADRQAQTVIVPFTTFQRVFRYGDAFGWFALTSRDDVPASVAEQRVISLLAARHRVAPDDRRAFGSWNTEREFQRIRGLFGGIGTLTWIVGVGTLAAGVIGVSNIMLVIVRERTQEIGVRRAIGATPLAITGQVVLEAVLLTAVAGTAGLLAGVGAMELTDSLLAGGGSDVFRDPGVSAANAFQALGILVVAGVFAGLMPAHRAVAVSPVNALRAEA